MIRVGIVVFPGTNCDDDCEHAWRDVLHSRVVRCWHREPLPRDLELVVIPGGFSFGDHLRCGAIAAVSPIMADIRTHVGRGGLVLGICNGFQILCEAGLLPGVLRPNPLRRYICRDTHVRVERHDTPFTAACPAVLRLPIAHGEGSYWADASTLARLESEKRVLFRYATPAGEVIDGANPNGSLHNIAGILNESGNVAGLMPHPERACDPLLGNTDGAALVRSLLDRGVPA